MESLVRIPPAIIAETESVQNFMERFFLANFEAGSSVEFDLPASESHHALHVLRLKSGDELEVFDGKGKLARAAISKVGRKEVSLRILELLQDEASLPRVSITLATAVPKGDRFRWLVEKATELGVARLVPLIATRSVVDPGQHKLQKLEQTVIAACKQSGRLWLMEIGTSVALTDFVKDCGKTRKILVADTSGRSIRELDPDKRCLTPFSEISVLIGPEGGFTEEELSLARENGAECLSLGPNMLRIETAAIALCSRLLIE